MGYARRECRLAHGYHMRIRRGATRHKADGRARSSSGSRDGAGGGEQYGEVLGLPRMGPQACELSLEAQAAMDAEATVEALMSTSFAHPTLYEAVGEAFSAVHGLA